MSYGPSLQCCVPASLWPACPVTSGVDLPAHGIGSFLFKGFLES